MTLLHPPVKGRQATITGRLIEHGIASRRDREGIRVALLLRFKRIEAGAQHEHELIAQYLTGGAQLAVITKAFAQQPRLAVGAAVAEGRKNQRDDRKAIEKRREFVNVAVVGPDHSEFFEPVEKTLRILDEPRRRNQHGGTFRQFGAIGNVNENVGGNLAVLNEWHRPAP